MVKRALVTFPNAVLRKPASEVPLEDIRSGRMRRLIAEMREILASSADGVGLAAPQVGVSARLFLVSEEAAVIDATSAEARLPVDGQASERAVSDDIPEGGKAKVWNALVFINPVAIKRSSKKIEIVEGCLSIPGKFGAVRRPEKISLEWYDETGVKRRRGFGKFFARVIQHELDHLEGVLIADRNRAGKLFRLSETAHLNTPLPGRRND